MFDRRKKQKAYIRVNKKGQIAPASLMYRDKAPTGAKFKEMLVPYPTCCEPTGCGTSKHLVDTVYGTSNSNRFYGIYSEIDANCNTYLLYFQVEPTGEPVPEGEGNSWYGILKQDPQGNIIWQKQINSIYYNSGNWFEPYLMYLNTAANKIFVMGDKGVMAIDLDGNVLWFKAFDRTTAAGDLISSFYMSTGYASPDASSFYVGGMYYDGNVTAYKGYVLKMDGATGDVVKVITNTNPGTEYYDVYGLTGDYDGNVIVPLNQYGTLPPNVWMFKFDSDLNVIWTANTSPSGTPGTYSDTPAVDYAGNIYMHTYWFNTPGETDNGVIKLDGNNGALVWRGKLYQGGVQDNYVWPGDIRFDPNNDIHFIYDGAITYTPVYQSGLNHVKVKGDGSNVEFYYQFYDNSGLEPNQYFYWWNSAHSGPNATNKNLLAAIYSGLYSGWLYKLPTNKPLNGVYNNITFQTFTDYTWSTTTADLGPVSITSFNVEDQLSDYWIDYQVNLSDVTTPVPLITNIP